MNHICTTVAPAKCPFCRIEELEAAAKDLLNKPPCSDPDCCSTAREESAARDRLQAVLNRA